MAAPEVEIERSRAGAARLARWLELPDAELTAVRPAVSAWSIARHLEHVAIVERSIFELVVRLADGKGDGGGGIEPIGRLALALRWIPRGRGKAPAGTLPRETVDRAALEDAFAAASRARNALGPRLDAVAASRATSAHPVFGGLTARRWLAFANVHTRHHERIVRDIDRRRPQ